MAELLQDQYASVFSNPNNPHKKNTMKNSSATVEEIKSIDFSVNGIIEAIAEISVDSATSDGGTPARIIKACKSSIAQALELLWKASCDHGKIPLVYKQQYGNRTI
jgi:hypothetical protein